ncbi:hypothetical protein A6R68_01875 [Neotoma lepida]|uniref:Uncharacterized protein n=1 Tax=Neotoma lepida TaxID=56216 RepID=A0A1A6GUH9_NEOLE|nr:hypothetical protein A6R68_01875 [Neotoma lepida]
MPTCPGGRKPALGSGRRPPYSLRRASGPQHRPRTGRGEGRRSPGRAGLGEPEPTAVRVQTRRCQRAGSPALLLRTAPARPQLPLPNIHSYRERIPRELGGHRRARRPRSVPDQPVLFVQGGRERLRRNKVRSEDRRLNTSLDAGVPF